MTLASSPIGSGDGDGAVSVTVKLPDSPAADQATSHDVVAVIVKSPVV